MFAMLQGMVVLDDVRTLSYRGVRWVRRMLVHDDLTRRSQRGLLSRYTSSLARGDHRAPPAGRIYVHVICEGPRAPPGAKARDAGHARDAHLGLAPATGVGAHCTTVTTNTSSYCTVRTGLTVRAHTSASSQQEPM